MTEHVKIRENGGVLEILFARPEKKNALSNAMHRAMADAEVAASLLTRIQHDIQRDYQVDAAPHELLVKLQRTQRKALPKAIESYFSSSSLSPPGRVPG